MSLQGALDINKNFVMTMITQKMHKLVLKCIVFQTVKQVYLYKAKLELGCIVLLGGFNS